jgi:invasion protein IalB
VNHIRNTAATEAGAAKRRGFSLSYGNRNSASIVAEQTATRGREDRRGNRDETEEHPLKFAIKRIPGLALPALALALLAGAAIAQEEQAPQKNNFGPRVKQTQQPARPAAAPEIIATHGDWKVQCEAPPANAQGQSARKQCGMVQTARSDKNPKVGLTLVLVKGQQNGKQVTMMRVMAPIGVYLPTGVALEVDGGAVGRVPFTRCLPQVCIAFAEASGDTLDKMRKGSAANFIIYEAPGLGLPMKISLNGFSAAYGTLDNTLGMTSTGSP